VNTPGGPWNIVLDVGTDPPQRGEKGKEPTFEFWDPPHICGTAEATKFKFNVPIDGWGPSENYATV